MYFALLEMHKAAVALSIFGSRTTRLQPTPLDTVREKVQRDPAASVASARLLLHYTVNQCFLPTEGYLLLPENLERISHIPTVIVQGRYDVMCPAVTAYELHKALGLHSSRLIVTLAGHSGNDAETVKHLVEATERFKLTGTSS